MLKIVLTCGLLFPGCFLLAGCSRGVEFPTCQVTGTVTFDGQPIPEGNIVFEDASGIPPDAGIIENGTFSLPVKTGKKIVRIRASRVVEGETDPGIPGTPLRRDYIPAQYNAQSELRANVERDKKNELNFELRSK